MAQHGDTEARRRGLQPRMKADDWVTGDRKNLNCELRPGVRIGGGPDRASSSCQTRNSASVIIAMMPVTAQSSKTGICPLCRQTKELRASHIIPEFAYKPIYDERHRMVAFAPADVEDKSYPQKGIRDRLLCGDCEQYFNKHFEHPFKRYWIDGDVLSRLAGKEVVILNDVDYAAFKLFHLSVLWRASVSSHGAFQQVRLGPHEEKIRQLLINRSLGEPWEYPIVCAAMTGETGDVQHNFVVPAMHFRYPGCRGYHFAFCGCQWLYYVASHHVRDLDHISLSADGRLPVLARPIEVVMKSIIAAVKRDARK
jgi:hypothetical protein